MGVDGGILHERGPQLIDSLPLIYPCFTPIYYYTGACKAMYSISHNFNKLAPPFESCVPGNLGMDSSFSQAKAGQVHTQIMRPREFSELFLFWKKYCAQYFLLVVQFCKKKNISINCKKRAIKLV